MNIKTNLIFPPFLGQSAGENSWTALVGFFITAVGFPILGVVAVSKSDGLKNLSRKDHMVKQLEIIYFRHLLKDFYKDI